MSERGSICFGDTTIGYQIRRSTRRKKTVHLTVDGDGVQVTAPAETPYEDLQAIVRRRAPWILQNAPDALLEAAAKRFVSGETLPYLGRNVCMVFEAGDVPSPEVRFDHWRFRITVPWDIAGDRRNEQIRSALVAWYRRRPRRGYRPSLTGGGSGSAGQIGLRYAYETSASGGEAVLLTAPCASTGASRCWCPRWRSTWWFMNWPT